MVRIIKYLKLLNIEFNMSNEMQRRELYGLHKNRHVLLTKTPQLTASVIGNLMRSNYKLLLMTDCTYFMNNSK